MEETTKRILIAGYFGFGNTGDEAILASMVHHLRGSCRISVVSGSPAETAKRYDVDAVSWIAPVQLFEAARQADVVLLGGGGLFHDYWGVNPGTILSEQHWGLSYFLAPAFLAAVFAKPLMLYAVGAGPLYSGHGRSLTRVACELASAITVRDDYSKQLIESLGLTGKDVRLTADPAFVLSLECEGSTLPAISRPVAGVCLRNWAIGVDQSFWEQQVASALDSFIEEHSGSAVFVPFQQGPTSGESDEFVAERVLKLMRNRDAAHLLPARESPVETAALLGDCDVVLGMRLHSLVFALRKGRPAVALSYDPKISAFMERAGLRAFDVPIGEADSDRILRTIDLALAGRDILQPKLAAVDAEFTALAGENNRIALELLDSKAPERVLSDDLRSLLAHFIRFQIASRAELLTTIEAVRAEKQSSDSAWEARLAAAREESADKGTRGGDEDRATSAEPEESPNQCAVLERDLAIARADLQDAQARALEASRSAEIRLEETVGQWEARLAEAEARAAQQQKLAERATTRVNHLCRELDFASVALERARAAAPPAPARDPEADRLRAQIAQMEQKNLGAIAKRGVHLALDTAQAVTPDFLRAAVRKYYLSGFYYRLYPERLPLSTASAPPPSAVAAGSGMVASGYAPFVDFKRKLYRGLPLNFDSLSTGGEPGRVSIVLPVYNGADYLAGSIESVLAQAYTDFELIVVDDGSRDGSAEVAERFTSDSRVRVIRQKNQKLPAALNTGFAHARGEFFTWTSHDNYMAPEQLSELVAYLRAHPDIELVYADEEIIGDDGEPLLNSDFCPGYQTPPGSNVICWPRDPGELNFVQNNYVGACFLYRGWAGCIAGGYDTGKFGYEDYEYWMRMNSLFRVSHLGKRVPLYKYRLHPASLSAQGEKEIASEVRGFMATEAARLHFFTESFDITLVGQHAWFREMASWYRNSGHNVFEAVDATADSAYHHRVTRAFPKSLVVFGGGVEEADLIRWTDPDGRTVLALLADGCPGLPTHVLARFDCVVATDAAWNKIRGCRCALRSGCAAQILYPLLAAANVRSFQRASNPA